MVYRLSLTLNKFDKNLEINIDLRMAVALNPWSKDINSFLLFIFSRYNTPPNLS